MDEFESFDAAMTALKAKAVRAQANLDLSNMPNNALMIYPNFVDGKLEFHFQEHRFKELDNGKWIIEEDEIRGSITA